VDSPDPGTMPEPKPSPPVLPRDFRLGKRVAPLGWPLLSLAVFEPARLKETLAALDRSGVEGAAASRGAAKADAR